MNYIIDTLRDQPYLAFLVVFAVTVSLGLARLLAVLQTAGLER